MYILNCKTCGVKPEIKVYSLLKTVAAVCPSCGVRTKPIKYTDVPEEASNKAYRQWNEVMRQDWRYVENGNPTEQGVYWVTLIYPEFKAGKKTGRLLAEIASRYLCDIDERPDLAGWKMTGEPDHGMVWTEETGSHQGESVWAWKPMEDIEIAELPDGVEVEE